MQSKIVVGSICAFLLGVGLRTVYEIPLEMVVLFMTVAFGLGLVWRRKSLSISVPHLLFASLLLFFFSLGIVRTEVASWQFNNSPLQMFLEEVVSLEGVVVHEPDYREKTVHLYIKTEEDLILVMADRSGEYFYGDKVEVSGKLQRPEAFETDLGRTFNYPGYLKAKGVEYSISFANVTVNGEGGGNSIIRGLLVIKQQFINSLQQVIPEPEVGLGNGLLLGVKSALGEDIELDFRRTGIIHIVVLSGYNVMLVVAFIMFCFSFMLPFRPRVVAGVLAIVCFALIVGLSATVVRASIMASLVLLSQVLGRQYDVMRALLLAGTAMILLNPYLLVYDIGFQLSFMATLGLLVIVPQFESTAMSTKSRLGLREFFLATVATQIAVLPLLMYHIGEVSLIAVLVNVLVLPVVPIAMLLTFLTGLLGFASITIASAVGFVASMTLSYILIVAKWAAALPFASVVIPQFSIFGVALMYGCMIAVWYHLKLRIKKSPTSEIDDWTVEEERDSVIDSADSTLPIFFR